MDHVILVDSSGFAHRAFHTGNPRYRESDGFPTGAVIGFMHLLWRMLGAAEADPPTHGVAVFDPEGKTFRYKLFPDYKGNRGPRSPELQAQFPAMRVAAETLGIKPLVIDGFEADDVVMTLAKRAVKAGMRVTIVSADKDFCQAVDDGKIEIVVPGNGRILRADVIKRFGVPPELMRDFQALRGDDVDNIPGIAGCGDERAAALIRRFGSLEAVLAHAGEVRWPTVARALKTRAADARLSYKLASLRTNVPLQKTDWSKYTLERPTMSGIKELLKWLEAPSQLQAVFQLDPSLARPVEPVEEPFAWWEDELKEPGQNLPDMPQCGFYKKRLVQGGPFVPAVVARERELDIVSGEQTGRDILICVVDGKRGDPHTEWSRLAMNPISKEEHGFMVADADHAKRYRAGDPKAQPRQRIDLVTTPAPRNPRA